MNDHQKQEMCKCISSFSYWCETYCFVNNGLMGIVPFCPYDYQNRLVDHWEVNQFSILSKFRQGGFSTTANLYGLWKCLFSLEQKILTIHQSERIASDTQKFIKEVIKKLPDWMTGSVKMVNDRYKEFPDTDSKFTSSTPEAACGYSCTHMIIDEAIHIKNIDMHWKSFYPILATGSKCVIMSTPYKDDDWFWKQILDSRSGRNNFVEFKTDYKDHPTFSLSDHKTKMIHQIGQVMWDVEMEQIPIKKVIPKTSQKGSKRAWRSIFDDWDESSLG